MKFLPSGTRAAVALLASALGLSAWLACAPAFSNSVYGTWIKGGCEQKGHTKLITSYGLIDIFARERGDLVQILLLEDTVVEVEEGGEVLRANGTHPALERSIPIQLRNRDGALSGGFVKCEYPPAIFTWVFGESIALFFGLESVVQQCAEAHTRACMEKLIAIIDVSGDGTLNTAEISRLIRGAGFFFSYYLVESLQVELMKATGGAALAGSLAPIMAKALINNNDYNGDGGIDLVEIMQDRSGERIEDVMGMTYVASTQAAIKSLQVIFSNFLGGLFRSIF